MKVSRFFDGPRLSADAESLFHLTREKKHGIVEKTDAPRCGAFCRGQVMKKLVIGILAHVDAGKTTLSEGLLYAAGALRSLGRVDHGDTFLDTEALERERGITIFSKQAVLDCGDAHITLLDTPGHVDFSAETERTLRVLDYAILVISGTDGVQSHTRTLWRLLERCGVPVFLFVNKMDLAGADRASLLEDLQRLGPCVDLGAERGERDEAAALTDEAALEELLERGALSDGTLAGLIAARKIFPCYFGSALKNEGVAEFLRLLVLFTREPARGADFGARVFKISRDAQGARLTHLKVTGGTLRAKTQLPCGKADQLRLYSGARFRPLDAADAGEVVAVTGLAGTYPGQGLGFEPDGEGPVLQSVLTYRILLPDGTDAHTVLPKLRELEDEDPMLRIVWEEHSGELHAELMGEVQLEILQRLIADRFGLSVTFGEGSIVYRETIADAVEGVGHFEPLRHYAEVHLLLEPAPRGSGVLLASACPTDALDLNWQRLILTHLAERAHPGVLTGSALTDVKITLLAGRAHLKHTEGGDFRQATYRAVRQGLMQAESVLLEPYYDFRLELPPECVGRAMTDLAAMGGETDAPEAAGEETVLTGFAPVKGLRGYAREVAAYTRGRGRLSCTLRGYAPCADAESVIAAVGYDPERDAENPTGSVFCEHGAGVYIPWDGVKVRAHIPCVLQKRPVDAAGPAPARSRAASGSAAEDKELLAIFESTYGKVERRAFEPPRAPARHALDEVRYSMKSQKSGPEYLLVDGYNIIFAWNDLKKLAAQDIAAAREALVDILANYRGWRRCEIILVFDAYKVKGNPGSVEKKNGIYVVYTKEAQTADSYIERATYDLGKSHRVRVATSDNLEQVIILGHGALRISARAFEEEVIEAEGRIADLIERWNVRGFELRRVRATAIIQEKSKRTSYDGRP